MGQAFDRDEAYEREHAAEQEATERQELARLKTKYEEPSDV